MFVVSSQVLLGMLLLLFYYVSCLVGIANCSNATRRAPLHHHQLSLEFYSKTCPQLDQLVSSVTSRRFRDSPVSAPATGCDASILIAANDESKVAVERDVGDNKSLAPEGFELVNEVKSVVESKCPGVVSCADILAIAARDFVHLQAGGPYYQVKKGRRDSKVSLASKVKLNLPKANSTIDELLHLFSSKGLNVTDLVALSGAHTIGFSHCDQFLKRLYNYNGTKKADPFIDPRLLKALQMYCPPFGGNYDVMAPFDVQTPFVFDHMYYGNLEAKMGLLATDQGLFLDGRTRPLVQAFGKDKGMFFQAFSLGMEKMGAIRVKRGRKGEVRKVCSKHNNI